MNIENYLYYIMYALVYLLLATAMKYILNFKSSSHYSADDQIADGNMAVGLRRSGAQLGLAIAMIGVMSGSSSPDIIKDLINTVTYGLVAMAFMLLSLLVIDKAMLPSVDNTAELKKGNLAIGMVEFGTMVMTGLLAYASIKGDEGGVLSSLVYFIAGQITLILLVLLYEKVLARKTNPVACVTAGNLSAGIYLSGKIIAYGLILQSAIAGNGAGLSAADAFIEFIVAAAAGMILLYVFEILIDLVIITSTNVNDIIVKDQTVAAVQLSVSKIGMALILGMAIL
ncbi:MAG: DUF350 domain-containing protein [Gammaproteobacteria bacterium]|nr:DUF350 domain-containing protein [Gammaproteobacteria bacterium]